MGVPTDQPMDVRTYLPQTARGCTGQIQQLYPDHTYPRIPGGSRRVAHGGLDVMRTFLVTKRLVSSCTGRYGGAGQRAAPLRPLSSPQRARQHTYTQVRWQSLVERERARLAFRGGRRVARRRACARILAPRQPALGSAARAVRRAAQHRSATCEHTCARGNAGRLGGGAHGR